MKMFETLTWARMYLHNHQNLLRDDWRRWVLSNSHKPHAEITNDQTSEHFRTLDSCESFPFSPNSSFSDITDLWFILVSDWQHENVQNFTWYWRNHKTNNIVLCSFQTDLALCINYKFEFCPKCSCKHALRANNVQILRTAFKDASD